MSYNRTNIFNDQISETKKTFVVAEEYRINPKSLISGGSHVRVDYTNGSSRIYNNIKNTEAYIDRILSYENDDIIDAYEIVA